MQDWDLVFGFSTSVILPGLRGLKVCCLPQSIVREDHALRCTALHIQAALSLVKEHT